MRRNLSIDTKDQILDTGPGLKLVCPEKSSTSSNLINEALALHEFTIKVKSSLSINPIEHELTRTNLDDLNLEQVIEELDRVKILYNKCSTELTKLVEDINQPLLEDVLVQSLGSTDASQAFIDSVARFSHAIERTSGLNKFEGNLYAYLTEIDDHVHQKLLGTVDCDSIEQLQIKKNEIYAAIDNLKHPENLSIQNPFAGIKNLISQRKNADQIKLLEDQNSAIEDISEKYYEISNPRRFYVSNYDISSSTDKVLEHIKNSITKSIEAFAADIHTGAGASTVTGTLFEYLREAYIKDVISKAESYPAGRKLKGEADELEATEILRFMFGKKLSSNVWSEDPQQREDREVAKARLSALPYETSSFIETQIYQAEGFVSCIPFLVNIGLNPDSIKESQSLIPIVERIKNNSDDIANLDLSISPGSNRYHYFKDRHIFDSCIETCKKAQGAESLPFVNINDWSIIKSALLENKLTTLQILKKADSTLANTVKISLLDLANADKHKSEHLRIHLGHTLYSFPDPTVIPVAILNAWAEIGTSGELPFRTVHSGSQNWIITKYLESITEDSLKILDQQGYTGVRELKNLANQDPLKWGTRTFSSTTDGEYVSTPNSEYIKTVDAVEQIILQTLKTGSYEEKVLAIKAYSNLNGISSEAGRKLTLEYLSSEQDPSIRRLFLKEMLKRGGGYEGDITLAKELLFYLTEESSFEGISPVESAYIFKAFTELAPTEEDIILLEKLSGIPKEDLTRTLEFIKDCTEVSSFNRIYFSVPYIEKDQPNYLMTWVEHAKNQDLTKVVKFLIANDCSFSESNFDEIVAHIEQYPNLLVALEQTVPLLKQSKYMLQLGHIPAIVKIHENIDKFSSDIEKAKNEIGDFNYTIDYRHDYTTGVNRYFTNPFYIAARSQEGSIWKAAATFYRKNNKISDSLATGIAELICFNNNNYEIPENLPQIVRSIVAAVARNEDLATLFDDTQILSALNGTKIGLNIDSLITHGPWVLESLRELATNKQFEFLAASKNMASLFSVDKKQLELLRAANYDSAVIFGVIAPILNNYYGELDLNLIIKGLPRSLNVLNDRYQLEYLVSFIAEHTEQNAQILGNLFKRGLPLHNGEGQKLIATLSFANSINDKEIFDRLNDLANDSSINTISELYNQSLKILLEKLSDRYPKNLLEAQDPTELGKFVQVYTTYEKTLRLFNSSQQIPIMRVIAVSQLLGKNIELRENDPSFIADFQSKIEEYIPLESERAAALSYLAERLVDTSPKMSWDPSITPYKYVIGEVSTEDRIHSVRNVLKTMHEAGHISSALRRTESIGTDKNPAKELAEKWKNARTQDEKDAIKIEQQKLELWSPLRTVIGNFEVKCSEIINQFQLIRDQKLQPYAECIEALGFTFYDSFGRRMFRGEIKLLTEAVDEIIKNKDEYFKFRDSLTDLKAILEEASKLNLKADNYLGNIADQISKSLILLSNRRDLVAKIKDALPGTTDTSKLCEAIAHFDSNLASYIRGEIALISDTASQIKFIEKTLQESEELTPIEDCKNLLNIAREAIGRDSIWTFDREVIFSEMLTAMVGQCLDYRSSKNSIGNSVYNISLVDSNRSVITARDESGTARLNVISYIAPIELEDGREMIGLVLDIPYTSDGSAITKDKTTGLLIYAHSIARAMQIPLVLPNRSMHADVVKDAASELHVDATVENGQITILPGPSGSTYIELSGYTSYSSKTSLSSTMTII